MSGTITLTKEQMKALIETSFYNGAISHNKWSGQRDTCWSNVKDDMKEESEAIIKELYETSNKKEI